MNREQEKKKMTPGKWIAIAVVLLAAEPELFGTLLVIAIVVAIIVGPIYLLVKARKQTGNTETKKPAPKRQSASLDERPKSFCFHRDKGEHHVRKGKEIDPWDRPDIDISKYQRKQ